MKTLKEATLLSIIVAAFIYIAFMFIKLSFFPFVEMTEGSRGAIAAFFPAAVCILVFIDKTE